MFQSKSNQQQQHKVQLNAQRPDISFQVVFNLPSVFHVWYFMGVFHITQIEEIKNSLQDKKVAFSKCCLYTSLAETKAN